MPPLNALLAAGLVSMAAITAGPSSAAAPDSKVIGIADLSAAFARTERTRVIVTLATAWDGKTKPHWAGVPNGWLKAAADEQTAALRDVFGAEALVATSAVAKRLAVKRSRYAPALSLAVTADEVRKLQASPQVQAVQIERELRPQLDASLARINAAPAMTALADGRGTAVAIIDSGVDRNHPFLRGKVVREACFSSNIPFVMTSLCGNGGETQFGVGSAGPCAATIFNCDHGTHVAGIAAGRNTLATGPRSGVARGASVVSIKVASRTTQCDRGIPVCVTINPLDLTDAMGFVVERVRLNDIPNTPIAAVNLSVGDTGDNRGNCDVANFLMKAQIDELRSRGVATVISAGNNDNRRGVASPGCISTAVTVGATNTGDDAVSNFSDMGPMVDLLAPGAMILSSVPGPTRFAASQGTSMAAPHVAGAIAALRSRVPTAAVLKIERSLRETGRPIADARPGGVQTRPRIDLGRALTRLIAINPDLSATPTTRQVINKPNLVTFAPSAVPFTLRGTGDGFRFRIEDVPLFLEVSRSSGTIGPGGSMVITVRPSLAAFALPTGTYDATIRAVNLDAVGDVAQLRLRVRIP